MWNVLDNMSVLKSSLRRGDKKNYDTIANSTCSSEVPTPSLTAKRLAMAFISARKEYIHTHTHTRAREHVIS